MAKPIIEIGKFNKLEVLKSTPQGLYVGDEVEEILLPTKYIPEGTEIGSYVDVFIYTDSEDRPIATTLTPNIQIGEIAYLKVNDVNNIGAFLDWGIEKDLLVPFREQGEKMVKGKGYLVYMYLDDLTDRLVGSAHVNRLLEFEDIQLEVGEEVDVLIGHEGELGYTAIINNKYRGLIYKNQVFKAIKPGDHSVAYIKEIRADKKIDLTLEKTGPENIEPNAQRILDALKKGEGFLPLHDKSDPDVIKSTLGISKKLFKKAVGALYKKRMVSIKDDGVYLK
ncbi:MAG: S1-like domain-containing RNA-binding protein [Marinoscillum sp.]